MKTRLLSYLPPIPFFAPFSYSYPRISAHKTMYRIPKLNVSLFRLSLSPFVKRP